MRKLFIAAAMAITCMSATAQSEIFTHSPEEDRVTFGARLSFDITAPGDVEIKSERAKFDILNAGCGFSFGGVVNIPTIGNFYFEPGVNFYYHTAKLDKHFLASEDGVKYKGMSIREFGMNVPLMIGYYFNFNPVKLSLFTGPELSLGLSGKYHISANHNGLNMSGSTSIYDDFNRFNLAWRLGVGVTYRNTYTFAFSAAPDLCKWNKENGFSIHRTNINFTLGYTLPF